MHLSTHWLVHLKWVHFIVRKVHFIVCKLTSIKLIRKIIPSQEPWWGAGASILSEWPLAYQLVLQESYRKPTNVFPECPSKDEGSLPPGLVILPSWKNSSLVPWKRLLSGPWSLKGWNFWVNKKAWAQSPGNFSSASGRTPSHSSRRCWLAVQTQCPRAWQGPPRGQRREATLCPAHRLPLPDHPTPAHMVAGLLPREQAGRGRKQGLSTHLLPQTSSGPGSPASPRPLLWVQVVLTALREPGSRWQDRAWSRGLWTLSLAPFPLPQTGLPATFWGWVFHGG